MMESRREDEDELVVEDGELATRYSSDVSPYGVGEGGNMRDWTVTRGGEILVGILRRDDESFLGPEVDLVALQRLEQRVTLGEPDLEA